MDFQQTVAREVSLQGRGLHSGQPVELRLRPAPSNSGIYFIREDLEGSPRIDALVDNVVPSQRNTTLSVGGVEVKTPEHLLGALWLTGIDNVEIALTGPEVPIMDGSAKEYVSLIKQAGVVSQSEPREYFELYEPVVFEDQARGSEIRISPSEQFRVDVLLEYSSPVVGYQHASYREGEEYEESLAPCRTFVFLNELLQLRDSNLIKGGALSNALVVVDQLLAQEEVDRLAELLGQPAVELSHQGYLSARPLLFPTEVARHKLLDTLGDFFLLGKRFKGHVISRRPGHSSNTACVKLLRKQLKGNSRVFRVDVNAKPLLDTVGVERILPHRPPFLLVDKIMEQTSQYVIGVKNVTMNEPFFVGHFPGAPVMPGVLQIEAMAQVGGILVLGTVPDPENYLTYFLRIDKARFRQQVVPGDTLVFYCELMEPIRRGLAKMHGEVYVGRTLVAEADLMAQISRRD